MGKKRDGEGNPGKCIKMWVLNSEKEKKEKERGWKRDERWMKDTMQSNLDQEEILFSNVVKYTLTSI